MCVCMLCLVSGCVTILGTFVHAPWTCHSASLKDEKRCVCLNFWAKCSHPWQVSKSQVKIIFFYSLFTFTLVLERNSSLIIISQVYVCLYALVYVCVCVAIFGTFVHTPWTCYSASLKDKKRCVCLNFWAKFSRPGQVSKSQVKIIYF